VLADGSNATESVYTSTTTARLEAMKAAAKPPTYEKYAPTAVLEHCIFIDFCISLSALMLSN
jgi:hypothetical protein